MEQNISNREENRQKSKYDIHLSFNKVVMPQTQTREEDSTFHTIVKQLGGGTWAESIAREILSEAPAEGEDN